MIQDRELTKSIKSYLLSQGAALVGVGDMSGVENCPYRYGISIAMSIPSEIVLQVQKKPTPEYYQTYKEMNQRLNEVVLAGEHFLGERGYQAYALTTERVKMKDSVTSMLPHKTAATRAGLGWIGKNCLLITEQYGSAVRLSTIYTDAPLLADEAVDSSKCGACKLCVNACPGNALKSTLWKAGMARSEIVDIDSCLNAMLAITKESLGFEMDICGRCFALCRYTREYLRQQQDVRLSLAIHMK